MQVQYSSFHLSSVISDVRETNGKHDGVEKHYLDYVEQTKDWLQY